MAKRPTDQGLMPDKAKVRVFFAEVEGNNESVQEALKTMLAAMNRPVRAVSDQRAPQDSSPLLGTANPAEEETPETVDDEEASVDVPVARASRGTRKKVDRNSGLELVPDMNFRPSGEASLREFINDKAPKTDMEAIVAFVYFMQYKMKLERVGSKEIYTAFKDVGRPFPVDLRQAIRQTKSSKAWIKFTDPNDIKTTSQGDNYVDHDMGRNEKR